jgi:DNA-binding CsgD family transcriptional regulator
LARITSAGSNSALTDCSLRKEITRSVARGLSNAEIATELYLSAHTVRDHLKAIFGKVGVGSRGELVAKLFADHYAPAMHVPGAPVQHVDR